MEVLPPWGDSYRRGRGGFHLCLSGGVPHYTHNAKALECIHVGIVPADDRLILDDISDLQCCSVLAHEVLLRQGVDGEGCRSGREGRVRFPHDHKPINEGGNRPAGGDGIVRLGAGRYDRPIGVGEPPGNDAL